ncbi:hypothetical protein EDB84DRAFT_1269918 [Lactarius hengduanensis]|nr:hypothetical protein EDB84DRAFT_1281180 [Lactarius hengduanensis]KAH9009065.1 hypothetical protein EDB84DRAFT_1280785 [Lactarius hengduanensis]KAH9034277.1 hypothetical protein EDB84DRAFT_1269918 [Lactarius hengduanensis]
MAAASLDINFKEELSFVESSFKVLSEAERTAALYSLLQHSTEVQIRFFISVLQQMTMTDRMTALLSPAVGGSMQSQMEAKLASMNLKSPGLKSTIPGFPSTRTFNTSATNRHSLASNSSSSFLSPDPPIPSATRATLPPRSPNIAPKPRPPATPCIVFLLCIISLQRTDLALSPTRSHHDNTLHDRS